METPPGCASFQLSVTQYCRGRILVKFGISSLYSKFANSVAFVQMWLLCKCGFCANVDFVQMWILCKCGFCANVDFVQMWLLCKCGFCANVDFVQMWLLCKCGFCANQRSDNREVNKGPSYFLPLFS